MSFALGAVCAAAPISAKAKNRSQKPSPIPKGSATHAAAQPPTKVATEELSGAWAWTTGTRTYLRTRPANTVPVVAKVPSRTKMFVWGKYNGWYRVETPDHTFGWVYHDALNCPKKDKIALLTHRKAIVASDRSGQQTLFGSPALLRTYYARYGAPGAARGLAKQGISLTHATKTSVAQAAVKIAAAKPATFKPLKASARVAALRTSPRTVEKNRTRSTPTTGTVQSAPSREARLPVSSPWGFDLHSGARDIWEKTSPSGAPGTRFVARPAERSYERGYGYIGPRETTMQNLSGPQAEHAPQPTGVAPSSVVAPVNRTAVGPSALSRARVAKSSMPPNTLKTQVPHIRAAIVKRAQVKAPARKVTIIKTPVARKAAPTRWQIRAQIRAKKRQQRLAASRSRLRSHLGLTGSPMERIVPPLASGNLRPISPEDLMRARDEFLASRHKTRPNVFLQPNTPNSIPGPNVAPPDSLPPNAFNSEGASAYPGDVQGGITRYGVVPSHYNFGGSATPQSTLGALFVQAGWQPANDSVAVTRISQEDYEPGDAQAETAPTTKAVAARASTFKVKAAKTNVPTSSRRILSSRSAWTRRAVVGKRVAASRATLRDGVVLNRGGSPRDYANYATGGSLFGQTMARQAMSYRGMPYIRGASSPNRGFDCSGLIYYLLRQRGYSPPRTSSDYASYGKPVGRGRLQSGDIVLFANTYRRGISHVGIYIGNNNFVHAARTGEGVRVDSLSSRYYATKFHSARRVK